MKRIIIVVEGQTEQEFVQQCLAPYLFSQHGIAFVSARLIGKPGHKGGDVRYSRLKTDLNILLREPSVIVSTFIDFFKLANDFPNFDNCQQLNGSEERIACLERHLDEAVGSSAFVPYIQRHEFEALLFASDSGFRKYFNTATCAKLTEISQRYPNPEDINSAEPPSYRLMAVVEQHEGFRYDKVTYGTILALELSVETMLTTCPRFAQWVTRLSRAATT